MAIVFTGRVFSIEVEKIRLANGREYQVETVRHGHEVLAVQDDAIRPRADLRQRGHPLTGGLVNADQVVAGHERELRLVVVLPAAHLLLGERDARGLDAHDRLPRAGLAQLAGSQPERLRLADPWKFDLSRSHLVTSTL